MRYLASVVAHRDIACPASAKPPGGQSRRGLTSSSPQPRRHGGAKHRCRRPTAKGFSLGARREDGCGRSHGTRTASAPRLRGLVSAECRALWVPIEKLFMTGIGFDNGSVAAMAATYAAVVPLLEVPSGILADRWSRKGVVLLAQLALVVSVVIGGLSRSVGAYIVAALFLGVFFAFAVGHGRVDRLRHGPGGDRRQHGVRAHDWTSPVCRERGPRRERTRRRGAGRGAVAPGDVLPDGPVHHPAAVALLRFREPQLHQLEEAEPLRHQIAATYRKLLERGALRPIVALLVLTALLLQVMLEFGPLWMVALTASAWLYGPHWAGLMAALGLGGLLGGRLVLTRPISAAAIAATIVACCVVLTTTHLIAIVVVAQVVLVLLVVAVSIPVTGRLHDAVPSTNRAGVASGVGTLTWLTFLVFAFLFGAVSDRSGVNAAGWTIVLVAALTVLLAWTVAGFRRSAGVPLEPAFAADQFRPDDDPLWPRHWVDFPGSWEQPGVQIDSDATVAVVREAIAEMPSPQHDVIVAHDIEGRSPAEVREELDLGPSDERDLLNQARGLVRARLDDYFEEHGK